MVATYFQLHRPHSHRRPYFRKVRHSPLLTEYVSFWVQVFSLRPLPINCNSSGSNLFFCPPANSAPGQGLGVTQNKGAAFIREPSLTPESHKVSFSAKVRCCTQWGKIATYSIEQCSPSIDTKKQALDMSFHCSVIYRQPHIREPICC
jgi:hypothetical protein